jgi:hypothetical protein
MATVAVQNGTAVNIGFAGTSGGISITSPAVSTKLILQSADEAQSANNYRVEDEVANVVVSAWSDPHSKVTLELIIKGTGLADAIASTALCEAITPGTLLVIGACQQQPGLVGTHWEVMDGPKVAGTNKDAKKFTVNLESRAGITAVAAA